MSDETLIEHLRARAQDPAQATEEEQGVAAPPASDEQITLAERLLGFRLPPLLRQVYHEVGDGGFGPGAGLPHLPRSLANVPALPHEYVLLCDWGCGIASLLDCSRPDAPVIRVDPNMPKGDVSVRVPVAKHYERAKQIKDACWVEAPSLGAWLEAWLGGQRLFYAAYGGPEAESEDPDDEEDDDDEEV